MLYAKKKRRPKKRKSKARDIAFHNEGIEDAAPEDMVKCDCGHTIEKNRCCKHHVMRKNTEELRYDASKALRLCFACHTEIHTIGEIKWAQKHKPDIEQWVYDLLMRLRGGTEEPEILTPTALSDIL